MGQVDPHPTVTATGQFGTHEIDSLLSPYVETLWAKDVPTWSSCQGSDLHPGYISGPQISDGSTAETLLITLGLSIVDEIELNDVGWIVWFTSIEEVD